MNARIDETGNKFFRLTAVKRLEPHNGKTCWLFQCECGGSIETQISHVKSGNTRSCGCLRKEVTRERSVTHGHRVGRVSSKTLKSYQHAKGRCTNPKDPKFPIYGGRGITMCQRWLDGFSNFLEDMGECPEGHTLDRIDPHKGYNPENCRWATISEQARTRTDNVLVYHDGAKLILKDFAALMGVNYKSLHRRVRYLGEDPHDAVEKIRR